ncbi:hypothetical protein LguiA_031438 [Lonicera macranthoides]
MENGGAGAAPTGCYKCGRPGHWSRDCPSSNPTSNPNPNLNDTNPTKTTSYPFKAGGGSFKGSVLQKSSEKPKKVPKTKPKLTPELLLSDDGLGYVLRHFPRSFKFHGRGHEVDDLGKLLGLYAEWHSHLIPYYSFDQFVHKVEQVGGSKRVKVCLRDLRERVARGGDPTKLDEHPVQHDISNPEQEAMNLEEPSIFPEDTPVQNHEADELPEVMLHEMFEKATEEPSHALHEEIAAGVNMELPQQVTDNNHNKSTDNENNTESRESQMSEVQKARIEANRLKALERAAARARASGTATT